MRVKCDATYVEYIGRGHEGFGEEYDRIGDWMLSRKRNRLARRITLVAFRGCDCRRRWIRVRAPRTALVDKMLHTPIHQVKVTAFCKNNVLAATVKNVRKIQFFLTPDLVDFSRPVTIGVNSRSRTRRIFKPDWTLALEESHRTRDRLEVLLAEVTIGL